MADDIYWPPLPSDALAWVLLVGSGIITILLLLGSFLGTFFFLPCTLPFWIGGLLARSWYTKGKSIALAARQATMEATDSLLMSKVYYVGGHPLVPDAQTAVLGLTEDSLVLYQVSPAHAIKPLVTISLSAVKGMGTGRPRSAQEIFDEDDHATIDVIEGAPFLRVIFEEKGHRYTASFSDFQDGHPVDWRNRIVAFRHVVLTNAETGQSSRSTPVVHAEARARSSQRMTELVQHQAGGRRIAAYAVAGVFALILLCACAALIFFGFFSIQTFAGILS